MNETLRAALLAQVEARQALNALPAEATDEDRAAGVAALNEADQRVAELLAETPADAPEELRDRVSLGRYLTGIAEQRALDGAEGELRTEIGLSDQAIPLECLLPTPEERADAVSPQNATGQPLPSGAINLTTGPLLNRVFTETDTAYLGIAMPMVPPGERRYPVMTGGTTASMQARAGEPDAGAARFDVVDANPHRLTGRYVLDLEGVAEMGGLLESTLRADLRRVMGFQFDTQVLNGDGTGANVSGLVKQLDLVLPPGATFQGNDPSAVPNWAAFKAMLTDGLDGAYARTEGDIRLLIGGATYTLARSLYRTNDSEMDAIAMMRGLGATVRRSFQIAKPAVATISPKTAASNKAVQSAVMNAEPGAAVAPVWQGITMIRDPYTNAGKAQIVLTAHMLFDFIMRRKDGWGRWAIRTEA